MDDTLMEIAQGQRTFEKDLKWDFLFIILLRDNNSSGESKRIKKLLRFY